MTHTLQHAAGASRAVADNVLDFPRRAPAQELCPTIRAANHAAAATNAFCMARRDLQAGHSRASVARALDEEGTLACLLIAARHAVALTGDKARDADLRAAVDQWLEANGRA